MVSATYPLFRSFFQAGFECSTHKVRSGRRLDLLRSTDHERLARRDYERVQEFGIRTVRLAARWHLIEESPGIYNFDSLAVLLDAALETGTEVLLDLLHFGWPDHVDVFSEAFPHNFGRFTHALTKFLKRRGDGCRFIAPVNEVSFLSWAGGDKARMNPYTIGRGAELKRNLIRAGTHAAGILLDELPGIRLISPEPVIHIVGDPGVEGDEIEAEMYRRSQFEAWDMLSGRLAPELGGRPEYLDIIGVNFYDRNEWVHNSEPITRDDPRYRPFHEILDEVWNRYRRPMFVSETGTEDGARAEWFNYICDEVLIALESGIPIHGVCLYPILNHPGWDDDRHCQNGLFDYADASGERELHRPLADAMLQQQRRFARSKYFTHDPQQYRSDLFVPSSVGLRVPAAAASDEPLRTY